MRLLLFYYLIIDIFAKNIHNRIFLLRIRASDKSGQMNRLHSIVLRFIQIPGVLHSEDWAYVRNIHKDFRKLPLSSLRTLQL